MPQHNADTSSPSDHVVDVIVAGAGIAGVSAAAQLEQAGLTVRVLEARERCGGRLHSVNIGGVTIDAGGQWIGPGQHRVLALAHSLGLTLVPTWYRGKHLFVQGGRAIGRRWMLPPVGPAGLARLALVTLALDRAASGIDVHAPWNTADAEKLDRQSVLDWVSEQGVSGQALTFLEGYLSAQYCRSIAEISVLEGHHQLATIGGYRKLETAEKWYIAEGAQALVDGLARTLIHPVQTAQPVRQIVQTTEMVRVQTEDTTWHARWLVVATPPAVTAAMDITPALPHVLSGSPTHMMPGDVIKVVAVYERPWWREKGLSGMCIGAQSPFSVTMDASPDTGDGILAGFASGPGAVAARECTDALADQFVQHVDRWLGEGRAPAPAAVFATDWTHEPFTRGGYAARRSPGHWTEHRIPNGARQGRLFFAGSESATAWRSYMEGALQSAERAAAEVIAAHRQQAPPR